MSVTVETGRATWIDLRGASVNDIGRDGCVVVYADWCPHCKDMMPDLVRLQEELTELGNPDLPPSRLQCYNLGEHSNYGEDATHKITEKYEPVKGFPSIWFVQGSIITPYEGPRTYDALRSLVFN